MSTYAIGDIHACYDQLQQLLVKIQFNAARDQLWFSGDLINGGPKPLETMRFIKDLADNCVCVLGNHDIVLLGIAAEKLHPPHDKVAGFDPILQAADREDLINWLRMRPILHYDQHFNALIVHAGVLPQWDLATVQACAREVEALLRGSVANDFYSVMFGNLPDRWDPLLVGSDRFRFIINCLTRMRFCDPEGRLELEIKGNENSAPIGYLPWFEVPHRKTANLNIIFGHWAALLGETGVAKVHAIDTGCMWGHSLTALRLDDWQRFSVPNDTVIAYNG
jgi:bis(5'-nucleosyl)-tetraphosphatase (symmetrical)